MIKISNNKGQGLGGYEALLIVILLGYSGYMTYLWASKASETKVFQPGARNNENHYEPHMGCVNVGAEEFIKEKKNGTLTNSVSK